MRGTQGGVRVRRLRRQSATAAAGEPTQPEKELTRIPVVNNAQIEHDSDAPADTYAVLNCLGIMAEYPE